MDTSINTPKCAYCRAPITGVTIIENFTYNWRKEKMDNPANQLNNNMGVAYICPYCQTIIGLGGVTLNQTDIEKD